MSSKFITADFIGKFIALKERKANVQIKHLLYGNQKMNRCVLHPFVDGERIGLTIEDEEKYITMDELCDVYIDDTKCFFKSDVMELYIDYFIL